MDWGAMGLVLAGGVLTIVGGLVGQWLSGRQAIAREQRDRQYDREVWARNLRYEAHIGFLNEFERLMSVAEGAQQRGDGSEPPTGFLDPVWDRLTLLRTVSDQRTIDAAKYALACLRGYVFGQLPEVAVESGRDRYLVAMRDEFGLPAIRTWEDEIYDEIEAERHDRAEFPPPDASPDR